ncbi:MAG: prefoldin subunit [Nanoarchaeota archaeon]|nr:prefoldin subunit [Nanoarchaeota archaeon]
MKIDEETNKKIEELQFLEQHTQHLLAQKQSIQIELNEANNALVELERTKDEVYKIFSGIMIKSDKEILIKEIKERKKILEMRFDSVDKQSILIQRKEEELSKEINKTLSDNSGKASNKN